MIPPTLLDSDTMINVMKRRPVALSRASAYLQVHAKLSFSVITRYEVLRGLHISKSPTDVAEFERSCLLNDVVPLTHKIVSRAAELYADLRARGLLIPDADILIAAIALEHGLVLATNNVKHFSRFPSLVIDNWLA